MSTTELTRPAVAPAAIEFQPIAGLEALRDEWSALADRSRNVFASWEFADTWWRHFGAGRELRLVAGRDGDGGLRAILPLYMWKRRPLPVLRFLGHGTGDLLGPVCGPEVAREAPRLLRRLLDRPPWAWSLFVGENLPAADGWDSALGATTLRHEGFPVLRYNGGFDAFLASRSGNFRRQARARQRRLERDHDVRFRLTSHPGELEPDLDSLFQLHNERWGDTSSFAGSRTAFHRAFARRAFTHGWLRLGLLEIDGRVAAASYGFRFAGVESVYQAGRDLGFQRESLGSQLLTHTIRSALDEGVTEFRLLRGQSPYKYRFATEDDGVESVALAAGRSGTAAIALARAVRSVPIARRSLRNPLEM